MVPGDNPVTTCGELAETVDVGADELVPQPIWWAVIELPPSLLSVHETSTDVAVTLDRSGALGAVGTELVFALTLADQGPQPTELCVLAQK